MDIETNTEIIEIQPKKKFGGRPLGAKNKPKTEKKPVSNLPKKKGRPFIYPPKENDTLTPSRHTYLRRGFLINKLVRYKKLYGLTELTSDLYVGKSNEEVVKLLTEIAGVVSKIKEIKLKNTIQDECNRRIQSLAVY